jgi:cell division protein FtsB
VIRQQKQTAVVKRRFRPGSGRLGLSATRLIMITAGFISVYFGFNIVGNRIHQYQLDKQNAVLEQQIATGKDDLAHLQALQQWMQGDAFVETMARKQGMIKPGDTPIIVSAPAPPVPSEPAGPQWWQRYFEPVQAGR